MMVHVVIVIVLVLLLRSRVELTVCVTVPNLSSATTKILRRHHERSTVGWSKVRVKNSRCRVRLRCRMVHVIMWGYIASRGQIHV